MDLFLKLLFICPMLFLAGIIDGIAGGGGIISLPAYLMAGLPPHFAYGCNKMQSCLGTSASLFKYAKSGFVDLKTALLCSITAIVGSFVSTKIMLSLSDGTIKIIIAGAMCFIIAITLLSGKVKSGTIEKKEINFKTALLSLLVGLLIGLYDGFFGPGGGTVSLMLFVMIFGYDMRFACGNGKVIIVISNLIALISYIANGNVIYSIAIPASIANIVGSYIGASLAVKNGNKLVRKILIIVVIVVLIQAGIKLI